MIYLSFHEWNFISPEKTYVGIDNFTRLLSDPIFLEVIKNTFEYTLLTVVFTMTISLALSLWFNKKGWIYSFVQGAVFSPHIIALVSVAMLWLWIMDTDYGLLNWVVTSLGFEKVPWLTDPDIALLSLVTCICLEKHRILHSYFYCRLTKYSRGFI